ncbi:MAG: hypothetical protein KBE09_05420 [Candidatus Pacebacteria bacterium]|nr:hypothetical protein [Candidatus Paceibacterota bacterium]
MTQTTHHKALVSRNADGSILRIVTPRPSNFHAHFRKDALMRAVTKHIVKHMFYVLAMPNNGPIRNIEEATAYHEELMRVAAQEGVRTLRKILMTLYHTVDVTPAVIERIAKSSVVYAVKHYPPHKGATTGSGHGIPLWESRSMLEAMEDTEVPLLGHFESVYNNDGKELPHSARESYFIKEHLWRIRDRHPNLRICFEHASTEDAVAFIKADTSGRTVGTFTPQHMLFTDDDFELYTWRNHLKCMPILKNERNRAAVASFATSGDFRAILGDDTAPHLSALKQGELDECANGCYLPHCLALYALAFERANALDGRWVRFTATNGPKWWGLPPPDIADTVCIRAETERDMPDPTAVPEENDVVIPLGWSTAGDQLKIGLVTA